MDKVISPIDFFDALPGGMDDETAVVEQEQDVVDKADSREEPTEDVNSPGDFFDFDDLDDEDIEDESEDEEDGYEGSDEESEDSEEYDEEDDEEEEVSLIHAFAEGFKERGYLPDDWDIPEDLTPDQFVKHLYDHVAETFDVEKYLEDQGLTKDVRELAKYIGAGMHPSMAHEGHRLARIANLDIEDNPDAIEAVLRYYYGQTLDPKNAERQIKGIFDDGEELEEASRIQKELAKKSELIFEEESRKRQKAAEDNKKTEEAVKRAIQTEKFGEKVLSKREQRELIKYNYEITDSIEVDGKKRPVTGMQKDIWEIYSDPVKYAKFSNIVRLFKDDFKELKEQAKVEAASSALDAFNAKSSKRKKKTTSSKSKSNWLNDASFLGDFTI